MEKKKVITLLVLMGSLILLLVLALVGYNAAVGAMKKNDDAPDPLTTLAPLPQKSPAATEENSVGTDPESASTETTNAATQETNAQGAQSAPDFTVYDLEGNAHKLSDFRGKPVVLNFWASWCGPCKSEMPDFDEIYKTYGKDIHFLMVNLTDGYQETVTTASSFISDSGYSFPVYYDKDMDAAATYGVSAVPVTYFIDKDGYLIAYGQGALDAETLKRGIGMIQE